MAQRRPPPTGLAPVERRLLPKRVGSRRPPPPPGSPRWSESFCPRRTGSAFLRPHRACPGGAEASAQEERAPPSSAPTGLAPVERRLVHKAGASAPSPLWCKNLRFTGASPVGRGRRKPSLVQKPSVHRDKPCGAGRHPG